MSRFPHFRIVGFGPLIKMSIRVGRVRTLPEIGWNQRVVDGILLQMKLNRIPSPRWFSHPISSRTPLPIVFVPLWSGLGVRGPFLSWRTQPDHRNKSWKGLSPWGGAGVRARRPPPPTSRLQILPFNLVGSRVRGSSGHPSSFHAAPLTTQRLNS